jgi:hypothetical protein
MCRTKMQKRRTNEKARGGGPGLFMGEINQRLGASADRIDKSAMGVYLKICSIMTLEGMNNVFV